MDFEPEQPAPAEPATAAEPAPYPDEPSPDAPIDEAASNGFDWLPEVLPTDLVEVGEDPELERLIRSIVNRRS